MVKAIVGGNWGDEGKGKITDLLASQSDIVIRFQGGANAGHTIVNHYGKFVLHLLPSGVFHKSVVNIIASSVAFDAEAFFDEINMLKNRNVPEPDIRISVRAQLLLPFHKVQDKNDEIRLGQNSFGSTQSGIAPFYSDKYAKRNLQISELFSDDLFDKAKLLLDDKKIYFKAYYNLNLDVTPDDLYAYLIDLRDRLKPYLFDCQHYINHALKSDKSILLEGQLGALRDTDNGIYPYVTSSSPLAAFGAVSAGIPPYRIKDIVTVVKAYSSCVGAGAFVCELLGAEGDILRENGGEYGATTGRARRVGYFDCVATRYGCMLQGTTQVVLTLLDVLSYLKEIPVCIAYKVNNEVITDFPVPYVLNNAEPVYEYLEGWQCDISEIKEYEDLPEKAKDYIDFIEKQLNLPISLVSNGPEREQILKRMPKLSK